MAIATDEARHIAILRGLRATADLDVALPLLAARRESLIAQAVADYRSRAKEYTPLQALLFVAALCENQTLVDDLQHVETQGRSAAKKLG